MSRAPIDRSADLRRLQDEGYHLAVVHGHLFVRDVPYVNGAGKVHRGILVTTLALANDRTVRPNTHVMYFVGEQPCHRDGTAITQIHNSSKRVTLAEGVVADHTFSAKPPGGYADYYDKVTTYVRILSGPAETLDPGVSARTYPVIRSEEAASVFRFVDTASSRVQIDVVTDKLRGERLGIIGVGGTGSYVLDLVAKTPAAEIRLIDGDRFLQHNAFRAPGAPTVEALDSQPFKVDYFESIYSRMHANIRTHPVALDESNLDLLDDLTFAFLCFDPGAAKRHAVAALLERKVPFVDVGMGIYLNDGSLGGMLRVTLVTPERHYHLIERGRVPLESAAEDDLYSTNIQVADLNALNAVLAVLRWKKLRGFYADLEGEHSSLYMLNGNEIINDEGECG
jgi:hypothetical protein